MDSDFQEKLKNVLSDPEALAKISAIASSLGMGKDEAPSDSNETVGSEEINPLPETASVAALARNFLPSANNDPRLQLLVSLKPLLREDKRDKIDNLTRALTVANMMKNFRK